MPITLQSTTGGFSDAFHKRLPLVERAMAERGLEPDVFIIAKDNAATSNARPLGPFFYEYTVFFDGEHFTVTEPNDARFLDYFAARILAGSVAAPRRIRGLFGRLQRWMNRPI